MPHVHLLVAFAAVTHRLSSGLVRVVAGLAGHGVVHGKTLKTRDVLEGAVAAGTMPTAEHLRLIAEDVAGVAIHRGAIEVDVGERRLFLVALCANTGVGRFESRDRRIVTVVAVDLLVEDVL